MLLIPSIKKTSIHPLQVFVKQSRKKLTNNSRYGITDPFVGLDGLLFDIRIRVETNINGLPNDNNDDTIINSRNISVDNTNTSGNMLNISEILPSLVSKTSSIFSGFFNKKNNDTVSDKNGDITDNTNDNNKGDGNNSLKNNYNANTNDTNNNNDNDTTSINDTSRSSSTDLTISPAERVKQRLAELRSNSKK